MRGSPLFHSLCAACVLLFAALPVWRLTHRVARAGGATNGAVATQGAEAPTVTSAIQLRVEFTSAPRTFEILHTERALWTVERPPVSSERTVEVAWPPEGIDLRVKIGWPDGAPLAAARISLVAPDGVEYQRSIWGAGSTDEVVTFP